MKKAGLYLMSLLYAGAGINHFLNPEVYRRIMPPWIPAHAELVALSGVAELVLALLLLPLRTRRWAAWGIILLLLAVFPANIQMALDWHRENHAHQWIAWARLPLQIVLIGWAWIYTKQSAHNTQVSG